MVDVGNEWPRSRRWNQGGTYFFFFFAAFFVAKTLTSLRTSVSGQVLQTAFLLLHASRSDMSALRFAQARGESSIALLLRHTEQDEPGADRAKRRQRIQQSIE